MKESKDILELLRKAKESSAAAKSLLGDGFYDFSASRSYYTMFYIAEALLLAKNLSFSKHSAVIGAFGKEFVKTKILPQKLREHLADAFDLRQLGDYGMPGAVNEEKAKTLTKHAEEFLKIAEKFLIEEGYLK
jgi:uncharacterized protein (UPF0332 family)